jgi:hypothetical protein
MSRDMMKCRFVPTLTNLSVQQLTAQSNMAAVSPPFDSHDFTPSNFLFPKTTLMLKGKRFNDVLYIQQIS